MTQERVSIYSTLDRRPRRRGHVPGRAGDVFNPSLGVVAARVALASEAEVDAAVRAARAAFPAWAATPALKRARVLFKFKEIIEQRRGELATLIASEHGKLVSDAAGEVTRGLEVVEFACGAPHLHQGRVRRQRRHRRRQLFAAPAAGRRGRHHAVQFSRHGAAVDVPGGAGLRQLPSSSSPPSAIRAPGLLLAQWLAEAGLPAGVFNVVNGDKVAVDALLRHPQVDAVSFVGSTPIAEYVQREGVAHGKRVQALGGAKNHLVMLPDADVNQVCRCLVRRGLRIGGRALHGDLGGGRRG